MGSSGDVAHTAMVDRLVTTLNSFLDSDLWKAFLICGGREGEHRGRLAMLATIRARAMHEEVTLSHMRRVNALIQPHANQHFSTADSSLKTLYRNIYLFIEFFLPPHVYRNRYITPKRTTRPSSRLIHNSHT